MRRLAFYGKGGIGKSTVASNIAYLFQKNDRRVLQIGCDPKHDSAQHHVPADEIVTAMDVFRDRRTDRDEDFIAEILMKGRNGVHCIEAGGPEPGTGCAGRAISLLLDMFDLEGDLLNSYDVTIYDVLGDVVCGGFATPIRTGHAEELFIVTSGEPMALYAANNILRGFLNLADEGENYIAGLVANLRGLSDEVDTVSRFAKHIGVPLVATLPRDETHLLAEIEGSTVCESHPESQAAVALHSLYKHITDNPKPALPSPSPMTDTQWRAFLGTITSSLQRSV